VLEKFSEHLKNRPQLDLFSDMGTPSSAAELNGHDCHTPRPSKLFAQRAECHAAELQLELPLAVIDLYSCVCVPK
jgi:hypothetical protein